MSWYCCEYGTQIYHTKKYTIFFSACKYYNFESGCRSHRSNHHENQNSHLVVTHFCYVCAQSIGVIVPHGAHNCNLLAFLDQHQYITKMKNMKICSDEKQMDIAQVGLKCPNCVWFGPPADFQQHMEFYHATATNQNTNEVATTSSSAAPASEDLGNYEGGPYYTTTPPSSSSSPQEYDPANPGYIPTPLKKL